MRMPGLNGLQVQARRLGIPVIFVTDDIEIRKRAFASGVAAFFEKPFDVTVFMETLRSVLGIQGCSERCS